MADNIEVGDLVAKISFDDTGLNKSMAEINRQMGLVKSEFDKASTALTAYGTEEEKLKTQADGLNQQMQIQQQKINKLNEAFQQAATEKGTDAAETQKLATQLNKAQTEYNKLDAELQKTSQHLDKQKQDLSQAGSAWANLQKSLDQASTKLKSVGESLKGAGESLTTKVSLPLAAVGGIALDTANDFEAAMGRISAQTGYASDNIQDLKPVLEDLWSSGIAESADEAGDTVSKAFQTLGEDSAEGVSQTAKNALTLKKVFGTDVNESLSTASVLTKNFGIDSQKAFDLMTTGFQQGGDFSGDLLDTLKEYAPQFSSMGQSADGMLSILITGAKNGAFNLDKIGDAVKEFNIRAQDGSKTTAAGFSAIGLDANKMGTAIASGGEEADKAFKATVAALASMKDPLKQNQAGVNLFGTQWEDVRKNVILAMDGAKQGLDNVAGATERASEAAQKGTGFVQLWRDFRIALEPVGDVLLNIADQWMPKVTAALKQLSDWFTNLSPQMQTMIIVIGGIAAAIGPLLLVLGTLVTAIGALLSPVGAVVLAIVGLAALAAVVVANWGPISGFFTKLWDDTKTAFVTAWDGIKGFFDGIWTWIKEFFGKWGTTILAVLAPFIGIPLLIVQHWDDIKAGLSATWNWMKTTTATIFGGIATFLSTTWNGIKSTASTAWNGVSSSLSSLWNGIKKTSDNIWGGIQTAVNTAIEWIKGLPEDMVDLGKDIMQGLIDGIASMGKKIKDKVEEMVEKIPKAIRDFLGIHSPSRVTMELGEYTGEGLALGLKRSLSGISQQAKAMASAAIPGMNAIGAPSVANGRIASAVPSTPAASYPATITVPIYIDGKQVAQATARPQAAMVRTAGRGLGLT